MNFSEDRDADILYLTEFELDWGTNNRDLSSDKQKWKDKHTIILFN